VQGKGRRCIFRLAVGAGLLNSNVWSRLKSGVRRREFIELLGGAATAWPIAAHGQQASTIQKAGFLYPGPSTAANACINAFFGRTLRGNRVLE
jgi:hypothetical protein